MIEAVQSRYDSSLEDRRRRRLFLLAIQAAALITLCPLVLQPSLAHADRYATSRQPHWAVGQLQPALSDACRRGRFNQIKDNRKYIAYLGDKGWGTTGIARQGWNLRDPDRRAKPEDTYHFADDGHSTCRVYIARDAQPATPNPPR